MKLGQCTYCGFCERFGCGNYSKASPQTCVLPALLRFPNFSAQTESEVTKINLDSTGKRATGVTYVDTSGEEWEQPANIVLVCAFSLFNVRLMLLSGIGKPYDPQTGQGVVGRNYAYQTTSSVSVILKDKILNPFIATGAHGMIIDDYNGDNFDHTGLGFVGGGYMGVGQTGARPIQTRPVPKGTPKWGAQWKKATAETYQRAMQPCDPWQFLQLQGLLSRSRSDLQGPVRPAADADDVRFSRQRTEDVGLPDRSAGGDCAKRWIRSR